jgi:internalin A
MAKGGEDQDLREAQKRIEKAARDGAKTLGLNGLGLTMLPPEIGSLTALQTLDLHHNRLTALPPEIGSLTALQTLDLNHNRLTTLPPEIGSLTALQALNLSSNRLTTLPSEIASLSALQTLDLYSNRLTTLPPEIGSLTALQALNIYNNELVALPPEISSLTALKTLNLNSNRLTMLPPEIGSLIALQVLQLSNNQLTTLPPTIATIGKLIELNLTRNNLARFEVSLGDFQRLEQLHLGGNGVLKLSGQLGTLEKLKRLNLWGNGLAALPKELGTLPALEYLNLHTNRLSSLPSTLNELSSLKELYLHNNPALGLPAEVLGPSVSDTQTERQKAKSPKQILQYYFDVIESGVPLQECKLIVVGRGGAGKTTLIKRLQKAAYDPKERETHGITISGLTFDGEAGAVKARVWDFGGQVVLHSMHEFFMTARSLYLLVLGERDDMLERDAAYWLQLIRSYAGEAPVIIALNKSEGRQRLFDRKSLEKTYAPILGWVSTECSEPDDGKAGIDQLRRQITATIDGPTMDSVRRKFPTKWAEIKGYLEDMSDSFVDYKAYQRICRERGEKSKESQQWLSSDLHDLGVALNYQNDPRLKETSVLRPDWLANGIYAVLRANDRDKNLPPEFDQQLAVDGKVTLASLERIYAKAEHWKMLRSADYPIEKRRFLLRLMDAFHLSYSLDDKEEVHLVPTLLPANPPEGSDEPEAANRLRLRYEFQVVPAPLIPWFIAKTFSLIPGKLHWRRGAMLQYANARGKLWTTQDERYVFVTVAGSPDDARQLVSMVRGTLRELFEGYKGLDVVEQHEYEGSWVPRATLEKLGILKPEETDEPDFEMVGEG